MFVFTYFSTDSTDFSDFFFNRNYHELNMNYPEIFLLRMIRTKSDLGGDGVSHHRSTSDKGRHDKRVYQCGPLSNV